MKNNGKTKIEKAKAGDRKALELVILEVQDMVYNLSLKMLLFPADAKDATQEILIRIITHLSTFDHKSQFKTWVYRVATNYLLTHKGKKSREFAMPFKDYANLIDSGHSNSVKHAKNDGELQLLEEEVKVSCTQGLLLCLNETDRMVYILSELLEFNGNEGAGILQISPESFRKKLSRSRAKIRNFLDKKCGLANPENPCRCTKKIDFLANQKIIDPKNLRFAQFTKRSIDLVGKLGELEKSIAIYRHVPKMQAPNEIMQKIKKTLSIDSV
ncbi:RNA polymerase sigma factor [Allomuricauda sp. d1]|uniref:RNA polymerase sigma factor n=1 Tax=Allomuricauda sp. d1 TaxID=3136725 RepID=UPI0031DBC709